MLIATKHTVYYWQSPPAGEPAHMKIHHDGNVQAITEHNHLGLVAIDDHLVSQQDNKQHSAALGLHEPITSLLIAGLTPLHVLIGTEGAHLYGFNEHSGRADRIASFDQLACRKQWYTPWGGGGAECGAKCGAEGARNGSQPLARRIA